MPHLPAPDARGRAGHEVRATQATIGARSTHRIPQRMKHDIEALKAKFRQGRHAEAIADCEALVLRAPAHREIKRLCATMHAMVRNYARALELLLQVRDPAHEDADILFNIGMCERELNNFQGAQQYFTVYTDKFPQGADGWASRAECAFQLGSFEEGVRLADQALERDASSLAAWTVRGNCQKSLGRFDEALASYDRARQIQPAGETCFNTGLILAQSGQTAQALESFNQAIQLAPQLAGLRVARGDLFHSLGQAQEAVADYQAALKLAPGDAETLKKATIVLLESGEGELAIALCRDLLKADPGNLTARLGAEWVLSQLVPLWHVPMMNEAERNQAFHDGLQSLVTPDKLVFEIGTGSGLLAMMAARLGARKVYTCEAVGLIASTAEKIIRHNHFEDRVTVLAKPSHAVQLGADLPGQADILVHEIFSSELLGEHVLPAIEDAKLRLLKPGGVVMPCSASIMIALVGGDALGKNLHVSESFGFDLREFNAIHPKKRPLYREDLEPLLMSADVEAFRFDFAADSVFPAQSKQISITANQAGRCYGVIQWIRIELVPGVQFENHPSRKRDVSNWQHTIYGFDEPVELQEGTALVIEAMHDRARPWFRRLEG
ncbi:MAG: tetratricopeptide repeat protein [Comamonadaceae bacterium]|nr:MAG: tetratricopeptide repeat protein [Comamonadaceae bacterium]